MPKARILAVDDQRYFRELIEGLLSSEGYAVETASSGEEALHVLEREHFDVVVTDLVMPGVDGSQLLATVKERDPDQDVVMVTGVVDVKTAVETMKLGATDFILKPFDRKTLLCSLDTILQRKRLREEHARLVEENLEYMEVLSLYERGMGLFSTLSLEPLSERLVEGLCLETRAQGGVIWVADGLGETRLRLCGARGIVQLGEEDEELQADGLPPEIAVLANSEVSHVTTGPEGDRALWLPVRHSGGLVALARLTDRLESDAFDDRDLAAGSKFVSVGGLALVNALRFRSLERRSFRDPVTKAYTHAFFEDVIRNEIQKANRFGRHFSIVRVDLGALGELRRSEGDQQLGHWLEGVVGQVGQALRSTDLLAVENEHRFAVLLPETDALGGAVLKERIRRSVEDSGVLDSLHTDMRRELTLAVATFPTDGTQLDTLERVLEGRLQEHGSSPLRRLDLQDLRFADAVEALLEEGQPLPSVFPAQAVQFLLREVARRPEDRGLLVLAPGAEFEDAVFAGLAGLQGVEKQTEVVVVGEAGGRAPATTPITWVPSERAGTDQPFFVYYGEGPAYAIVSERAGAEEGGAGRRSVFHTSDRALVEHLAFQLQRDLGLPLGA